MHLHTSSFEDDISLKHQYLSGKPTSFISPKSVELMIQKKIAAAL